MGSGASRGRGSGHLALPPGVRRRPNSNAQNGAQQELDWRAQAKEVAAMLRGAEYPILFLGHEIELEQPRTHSGWRWVASQLAQRIRRLVELGLCEMVVTTDISGSCRSAGIPREKVAELYGNGSVLYCDNETCAEYHREVFLDGQADDDVRVRGAAAGGATPSSTSSGVNLNVNNFATRRAAALQLQIEEEPLRAPGSALELPRRAGGNLGHVVHVGAARLAANIFDRSPLRNFFSRKFFNQNDPASNDPSSSEVLLFPFLFGGEENVENSEWIRRELACAACGRALRRNVVLHEGDVMPLRQEDKAWHASDKTDLCLVVNSTLADWPACEYATWVVQREDPVPGGGDAADALDVEEEHHLPSPAESEQSSHAVAVDEGTWNTKNGSLVLVTRNETACEDLASVRVSSSCTCAEFLDRVILEAEKLLNVEEKTYYTPTRQGGIAIGFGKRKRGSRSESLGTAEIDLDLGLDAEDIVGQGLV